MARVALVLVLIFSAALLLGVCQEVLFIDTYPNPVVVGRPFKLVVQSDGTPVPTVDRECSITTDLAALSIYNISQGRQRLSNFIVKEAELLKQTWDAVAFTCPKDRKDFKATLTCGKAPLPSTPPPTTTTADIGVELEGNLSLQLQTKRNLTSDDFELTLSAQNNFIAAPLHHVICNFTYTSGLIPKPDPSCTPSPTATQPSLSCVLNDFIHPGVQPLKIHWDGSNVGPGATISVTCDAQLGPISCPALASAKIDIPPPRLRIGLSKTAVTAGDDFTLTATLGGDAGKNCTLELPDGTFHLAKAKDGADCTQVNKTNTYSCNTKGQTTAAYDIHVDSSAHATTGDKKKAVNLSCGTTKAVAPVAVLTQSELDDPVLKLFRVGTQNFKVSAEVKNKGPSDASVNCSLRYPAETFKFLDKPVVCGPDVNDPASTLCILLVNAIVPGKDGEGKVPKFEKNFTMPHVQYPDWQTFKLYCNSREAHLSINYGNVTSTDTDVLKPDDKTVKQPDSYFWTYTIVIINLFLIALVVFIGMWWRNRAIARSMAGAERVDRFNEMEMFSSDHRPLSKAE